MRSILRLKSRSRGRSRRSGRPRVVRKRVRGPCTDVHRLRAEKSCNFMPVGPSGRSRYRCNSDFRVHHKVPGIRDFRCHCQKGRQTVRHVLLACRRLRDLRKEHLGRLPGRTILMSIPSNYKLATRAIQFIERAQILGQNKIEEE